MSAIITGSNTTPEGEMLWCIHFASSYYDSDSRGSGQVPVDRRIYVLAKGRDEAIKKAQGGIDEARKQADKTAKEKITATIITLEELFPARDSSDDGRMGWHSIHPLTGIALSAPEDAARHKLAVCLIPV